MIHRLGLPSELAHTLERALPRQSRYVSPVVRVTPRDSAFRKCAAWAADLYEVQAFYTTLDPDSLDRLEAALAETPGVYLTTQVRCGQGRNTVSNSAWPAALGVSRRGFHQLRPQVLALIRDEPADQSEAVKPVPVRAGTPLDVEAELGFRDEQGDYDG